MKLNKRLCKNCKKEFQKTSPLQSVCSPTCAIERSYELNKAKREKEVNDKVKDMKVRLMKRGDYIKLLQAVFNTYIRKRDENQNCISCDTPMKNRKGDASHYYPTTYTGLRFNEDNVHLSCVTCNQFKHGNLQEYRPRLIAKIGLCRVTQLDNLRHSKLELSIEEIQEMIAEYKFKTKELKK